jgi:hypothetical protein
MFEIYAVIAGALIIAGAAVGILTVLAVGIHREEKAYSLTIGSPGRISSGARAATGVYTKAPGVAQQPTPPPTDHRLALASSGSRI